MKRHQEIDLATSSTDDYIFCDGDWVYVGKRTHEVIELDETDHPSMWEKQLLRLAK